MSISFTVLARTSVNGARLGVLRTPHGEVPTPAFMPVGTAAALKGLTVPQVRACGASMILNNAYHLMLRPGERRVAEMGGVQRFMGWNGPILTDSGGFQAFSMSATSDIDEDGVTFRSFVDGSRIHLGPERSMEVQHALGADVIMAFDDCPPTTAAGAEEEAEAARAGSVRAARIRRPTDPAARAREAHQRTIRWLERCVRAHRGHEARQALFGIVQGGTDLGLREESVAGVCAFDLPGFAIGGVAVGESTAQIRRVVEFTAPRLPADRPRYLMGVGYERDIVAAVAAGVDMFDCVLPTRSGRNALAFTRTGPIRLRNAVHAGDPGPIDPACDCEACAGGLGRAYLRHLFMAGEMLGPVLTSLHNVRHFQRLLLDIRRAIRDDAWSSVSQGWPCLAAGGEPPEDLHAGPAGEA